MQFLERQCLSDHATADIIMPDLFYFTRIFLFLAIEYGNAWICIQLFKTLLHMIGQMISTQWTHVDLCLSTVSGIGHVLKPPNVCPDDVYGWGEKGWCEANTTCTCLKSLFASQIVSLSSRHPWNFKKNYHLSLSCTLYKTVLHICYHATDSRRTETYWNLHFFQKSRVVNGC